ncbi:MAG: protein kinase [Planctomycetes bacterium]|nr:protein kinase [Planctomycetota bacterium]
MAPSCLNELPGLTPEAKERAAGDEPIPGYRLVEPLGKGGFGVVWKCVVPGGFPKAIKFVNGNLEDAVSGAAHQELQALECIKAIRHPFLLTVERVEILDGELMIVMELADQSLADVLRIHQSEGRTGIPCEELLDYLLEAAEALDVLNFQHGLQHLDIKPQNLFLVGQHIKVADFGLVNPLPKENPAAGSSDSPQTPGVTPRYAAPEVLLGKISPRSDQYSLAIVYQELLTGTLPFSGGNPAQLMMQQMTAAPDLSTLPEHDRAAVARALAKDPEQRFASCLEFLRTLLTAGEDQSSPTTFLPRASLKSTAIIRRLSRRGPGTRPGDTPTESGETESSSATPPRPTSPDSNAPESTSPESASPHALEYLECLRRHPFGETWLVRCPDGSRKLAQIMHGFTVEDVEQQARLLKRLQDVRNPGLIPFEVAEHGSGRIVLLGTHYETTLQQLAQQRAGKEIPPQDLLETLGLVGETLDTLARQHQLFHLMLHPTTIILTRERVLLRDFGLIQLFWKGTKESLAQLNPHFAAPELERNQFSQASDQFSLALMYAEFRCGYTHWRTTRGVSANSKRSAGRAGLNQFPVLNEGEREVLRRALNPEPAKRFATCGEMIEALEATQTARVANTGLSASAVIEPQPKGQADRLPDMRTGVGSVEVVSGVLQHLKRKQEIRETPAFRYRLFSGNRLEHHFAACLIPSMARLRLELFCQEAGAAYLEVKESGAFRLFFPAHEPTLWQRWLEREVGLEIHVELSPPVPGSLGRSFMKTCIKPVGCNADQAKLILEDQGPKLLGGLRQALGALPENRREDRLPFHQKLTIYPEPLEGQPSAPLQGIAKDISSKGIGLFVAKELVIASRLTLLLPPESAAAETPPVPISVKVVRVQPRDEGGFEIGAVFLN